MEKPTWVFGSEESFVSFIDKSKGKNILIISHTDVDGISAAKVVNHYFQTEKVMFADYGDLNVDLLKKVKEMKPDKIVITDLFFKDNFLIKEIEKFADVLIIDHHSPNINLNSDKTIHLNSQGFCATYLAYYLFSKVEDNKEIDWLVACASMADILYFKNKSFMESVFEKYGDKFELNGLNIRKNGIFWDYMWDLSLAIIAFAPNYKYVFDLISFDFQLDNRIEIKAKKVQEEYDILLKSYEKERQDVNGRIIWYMNPKYKIGSIIITEISFENQNQTILTISDYGEKIKFSARRQDGKEDLNALCSKLVEGFEDSSGGGHFKAAGGFFPRKYLKDFKERLQNL